MFRRLICARRRGWYLTTAAATLLVMLAAVRAPAAEAATPTMLRWAYVVGWDRSSYDSLRRNLDRLDYVSPFWFGMDGAGQITRNDHSDEIMRLLRTRPVKVVPTVKNAANGADFHPVLRTAEARRTAVERIIGLVNRYGYDGIHIDFEDLLPTDRGNLTAFQGELWARLKPAGKLVTMTVNAKTRERFDGFAGAHDYRALAQVNDLVLVQAYGYTVASSSPGPGAPIGWVEAVLAYSLSTIPREKLLLGIPSYGFTWNTSKGPPGASISYEGAMGLQQRFNGELGYDEVTQTPWLRYVRDGDRFEAWFENQRSQDAKIALARRAGVRGIGVWRLGFEDPASWTTWPRNTPPPNATYWLQGYPERGTEGCAWYVARWSDGSWTRTLWDCPAGVRAVRSDRPVAAERSYPERGAETCVWYVTRWADGVFTRVPFECPPDVYALKPDGPPGPPGPALPGANNWQRGYAEAHPDGCTWYVALWRDGSYSRVPWRCPEGARPNRGDRSLAVERGYPERGREGCVWYVARWADGAYSKVPFECPAGVSALKP